jgi:copper chaperone CopZ
VSIQSETIQVSGVRCEQCIGRLAVVLRTHDGLVEANANLMGRVDVAWDDERTSRGALVEALRKAGFPVISGA